MEQRLLLACVLDDIYSGAKKFKQKLSDVTKNQKCKWQLNKLCLLFARGKVLWGGGGGERMWREYDLA